MVKLGNLGKDDQFLYRNSELALKLVLENQIRKFRVDQDRSISLGL